MRLRTRLTLAFAFITVFAIAALLVIAEFGINDLTDQNIKTAIAGVEEITSSPRIFSAGTERRSSR